METCVPKTDPQMAWNNQKIPVNVAFEGSFVPSHSDKEGPWPLEHFQLLEVDGYWIIIKTVIEYHKLPVVERVCFCLERDAWEWLRDQGVEKE